MKAGRILALAALVALCLTVLSACSEGKAEPKQEVPSEDLDAAYAAGYAAGEAHGREETEALWQQRLQTQEKEEAAASPDSGFVLLSQAIPDAILEIRYYSTYNFVGERIQGYEEPVALLTREAAAALQEVSDELAQQGYRLKIFDAYRPQQAVEHFKTWAADPEDVKMKAYFYPDMEKSVLFQRGFISSRSGHSRGSTVDLTLFDMTAGKEVDMGGRFDYFDVTSYADYADTLTPQQQENRRLLRETMQAHGFRGIATEWWHFTLADEPYPDTYFDFPVKTPD